MSCVKTERRGKPCDFCTKKNSPFCCPRCKSAFYCSREHFKSDSKLHKRKCSGYMKNEQTFLANQLCPCVDRNFLGLGESYFSNEASSSVWANRTMKKGQSELANFVVKSLYSTGRCIVDNFNGNSCALKILEEVKALHQQGTFKDGQLASKLDKTENGVSNHKIREDIITWVGSKDPRCIAVSQHMTAVDKIIYLCNKLIPNHDLRNRTDVSVLLFCELCQQK